MANNSQFEIIQSESVSSGFSKILSSINSYLSKNKNAVSDFNLIKDIVERNTNSIEEDINLTMPIPLYLGLMGTMIGIVIGLFNMSELSSSSFDQLTDDSLGQGISVLLGGVKIAMISSFTGLLLTIVNSGWYFKEARKVIEERKNEFYSFVQIELLPVVNQSLSSTLESLQRNLNNFNTEFSVNIKGLSGIFKSNIEAINLQKELLEAIDKTKMSEMTKYNVKVLQELQIATLQFEKFNNYLINVNAFVANSQMLTDKTNELLERTSNFKSIADNLNSRLHESQLLLEFLSTHFKNLEDQKKFVSDTVADVGSSISDTFKELKIHIQNSSQAVKDFTVDEIEALRKALSESKTNLNNLAYLESLNKDVGLFKNSAASQGERLKQQLEDLNKKTSQSIEILLKIENNSFSNKSKKAFSSIKRLFSKK